MEQNIKIINVNIEALKPAEYNPRKWSAKAITDLKASISSFGLVDPIIVNSAKERNNIVIGGHFRLHVAKLLGYKEVPVVYVDIPDVKREMELNVRLNKNNGEWNFDLLANFDEETLLLTGFDTKDFKNIFSLNLDDIEEPKKFEGIKINVVCPPKVWIVSQKEIVSDLEKMAGEYGLDFEVKN